MLGSKTSTVVLFSVLEQDARNFLNWQTIHEDGGIRMARLSTNADIPASSEEQSAARDAKYAKNRDRR